MLITQRDIKYFNIAKSVSKTSEYPRIKIGCCIVKKNRILAVGVNLLKSHPTQKLFNNYRDLDSNRIHNNTHAELDAVLKVYNKEDLKGSSIYLYRESSLGELKICRPCGACMELLKKYNIKNIYYTDIDGYYKEVIR